MLYKEWFVVLKEKTLMLVLIGVVSVAIFSFQLYSNGEEFSTVFKPENQTECLANYDDERDSFWGNFYRNSHKTLGITIYKFNATQNCPDSFYSRLELNLKKARKYSVLRTANCYRQYETLSMQNNSFPVIVTAISSNHFEESSMMIQSVQKSLFVSYPAMKLIVYDIGLKLYQLKQLTEYCVMCEIRRFPFEKYKPYVSKLKNYVWKPIIIYTVLQEYKFVIWSDSSVNFFASDEAYDLFFKRTKAMGILVRDTDHPVSRLTKLNTFEFFDEPPCLYDEKFQFEANMIAIWNTDLIWKYVILPWVSCALTEDCMSAVNPEPILACINPGRHACHRFDQSVLNIILFRIFGIHTSLIINTNKLLPIYNISRGQRRKVISF